MSRTKRYIVCRDAGLSNPRYVPDGSSDHIWIQNARIEFVEDALVKERRKVKDMNKDKIKEVVEYLYGGNFYKQTANWIEETNRMSDLELLDTEADIGELKYLHSLQNTDLTYAEWVWAYINNRDAPELRLPKVVNL